MLLVLTKVLQFIDVIEVGREDFGMRHQHRALLVPLEFPVLQQPVGHEPGPGGTHGVRTARVLWKTLDQELEEGVAGCASHDTVHGGELSLMEDMSLLPSLLIHHTGAVHSPETGK